MRAYFFSDMAYPYVPESVVDELRSARVNVPNAYCDPVVVAALYDQYLEEFEYAAELGLDLALSEHHQSMTCLNPASPLTAAILARRTERARIAFVGIPLPARNSPVRAAEELAMLDCMSRGRIIVGMIRGVATEVHPGNIHAAHTRERMREAHDLIVKTWTEREPFSWEGKHWHYRYVNPWPRPYQQPHPTIWWTGAGEENARFAAERRYPFAVFLSPFEHTEALFDAYRRRSRELGHPEPTPDRFAYLGMAYTAETDAQAEEDSRGFLWYFDRRRYPHFHNVPGFAAPAALARNFRAAPGIGQHRLDPGGASPWKGGFDTLQAGGGLMSGSPDTMIRKITYMYERYRMGHLLFMGRTGAMPTAKVRRSLELFAREVYPAVRHLGAENEPLEDTLPAAAPVSPPAVLQ